MVNGLGGEESVVKVFLSRRRFFVSEFYGRFPVFQLRSMSTDFFSKRN